MPRHQSAYADPELAQRIKSAREQAGLTLEQVARACGVCVATYQNWEGANSEPKVSQFRTLCRTLSTTPSKLL